MDERRETENMRHVAQEAAALAYGNTQSWTSIILCIVGICGVICSISMFFVQSIVRDKVAPIEMEVALIKQDQSYVKKTLEEIKALLLLTKKL